VNISYFNFPEKKKLFLLLSFVFTLVFYKPILTLSDQHIPPQEQEPPPSETIEYPSPKQIPPTQDTVEFPTKIEVPQKLPSTKDIKDIGIQKQPTGGTQLEQPIPVPGVEFPSKYTPVKPTQPSEEVPQQIVYKVIVCDKATNQLLPEADVELSYFGNKLTQRSNKNGVAEFTNLYPIEVAEVEVKKQGYKKAEISTSIFASKTDKICVSKDLVVIKPSDPPVIVSGPKEPIPIPTSTQPPVVSQPTDTSQTPTLTPVPPGTYEQLPVAQTPKEKKLPPNKPKKDKPPVDIDRQTETTSGRSEELIYEEEAYPETVVGDAVANKDETDEKIGTVARLLKDKRSSQTTDNKDDDLIVTKGGESGGDPAGQSIKTFYDRATLFDYDWPDPDDVVAWYGWATMWVCDANGLRNYENPYTQMNQFDLTPDSDEVQIPQPVAVLTPVDKNNWDVGLLGEATTHDYDVRTLTISVIAGALTVGGSLVLEGGALGFEILMQVISRTGTVAASYDRHVAYKQIYYSVNCDPDNGFRIRRVDPNPPVRRNNSGNLVFAAGHMYWGADGQLRSARGPQTTMPDELDPSMVNGARPYGTPRTPVRTRP